MFVYSSNDVSNRYIISVNTNSLTFCLDGDESRPNASISASELFPIGSIWKNKKLIHSTASIYSAKTGWSCCLKNHVYIKCASFGNPDRAKRNFALGQIQKNCTWNLVLTSTKYENKVYKQGNKKRPVFDDDTPVIISSKSCFEHGGMCSPCSQQQIMQRSRSGQYIKHMSTTALYQLCNMFHRQQNIKSSTIKAILKEQFPSNKNVTSHHVFNMKKKLRDILPLMQDVESFKDFQHLCNTSNLVAGLEDIPLSDDNAAQVGKEVWEEIMSNDYDDDVLITFKEFMSMMEAGNAGFRYQMFYDTTGRCTGCVWQTATMRDNFDRFGGFFALDAMKRALNTLLWPYVALTMYNELEMICLGCEGIFCTERDEAYIATVKFVIDNVHCNRKREEVYVVAADGFANQDTITNKFNLPNAIYMADQFHLFEYVLPNRFGDHIYSLISSQLKEMCHSSSEDYFNNSFRSAMEVLRNLNRRDGLAEKALCDFRDEKNSYAAYILSRKRCTRGKHGSSLAESNHSSVLVYLNEGGRKVNDYLEKPHTLVKDLFQRQTVHINNWNTQFYSDKIKLTSELGTFSEATPNALREALSCLCRLSYERFKSRFYRINEYSMQHVNENHRVITNTKYVNAKTRNCYLCPVYNYFKCNDCEASISYEEQCEHCILANDLKFIKHAFDKRHFRREVCSGTFLKETHEDISHDEQDLLPQLPFAIDEGQHVDDNVEDGNFSTDFVDAFEECNNQADHYENDDFSRANNKIKPLSFSAFKSALDTILSKYEHLNEQLKFTVGSLVVTAKEISTTGSSSDCGLLSQNYDSSNAESLLTNMVSVVQAHKHAFLPQTNVFNAIQTSTEKQTLRPNVLVPQKYMLDNQVQTRLVSRREQVKRRKINDVTTRVIEKSHGACSFCGGRQKGHKITNCTKRKLLSSSSQEYKLSNKNSEFDHLRRRIESDIPLVCPSDTVNLLQYLPCAKARHIFIHNVWSDTASLTRCLSNLCYEISIINKVGLREEERHQINGQCFVQIVSNMNSTAKPSFIYDGTDVVTVNTSLSQQTLLLSQQSSYCMNRDPEGIHEMNMSNDKSWKI